MIQPRNLARSANADWVMNEAGIATDFRVEGDTDENLLFTDASTDRVGIGTDTPAELFDVDGVARCTTLNIAGTNVTATAAELNASVAGLLATTAEINRAADVSARLIAAGAALTLTVAAHDGKTILLDTAAGSTVTLPAASGSGAKFTFKVSVTATTNSHIIKVANANDIIQGVIFALGDDATSLQGWEAGSTADTITFNRTTTGLAAVGHFVEIEDVKTNMFACHGIISQSGTEATPFSATV